VTVSSNARSIPRTIADVFAPVLADDPGREALVTRSGRWSYAELDRLAARAAHALRTLGVPAQLIVYPGQYHTLTRPTFLKDRAERAAAWFTQYLLSSAR